MAQTPGCCDTEWELVYKILVELQSLVVNGSTITPPLPNDSEWDLYRKILLTLPLL